MQTLLIYHRVYKCSALGLQANLGSQNRLLYILNPEFQKGFTEIVMQSMSNRFKNIHTRDASDQNGCSPFSNTIANSFGYTDQALDQTMYERNKNRKAQNKDRELQLCNHMNQTSFLQGC